MSIHTRREKLSWIMASLLVGAVTWQVFFKPVWTSLNPPPAPNAPTATPTPDMRLYELRQKARFHVEYGWTAGLEGQSSTEELTALMGEPDGKYIIEGFNYVYWYYILDPGKNDMYFLVEDGKVQRTALGPLFKKRVAARREATKTYILESMEIMKLEKEAPAKQLTQVHKLKQEDP